MMNKLEIIVQNKLYDIKKCIDNDDLNEIDEIINKIINIVSHSGIIEEINEEEEELDEPVLYYIYSYLIKTFHWPFPWYHNNEILEKILTIVKFLVNNNFYIIHNIKQLSTVNEEIYQRLDYDKHQKSILYDYIHYLTISLIDSIKAFNIKLDDIEKLNNKVNYEDILYRYNSFIIEGVLRLDENKLKEDNKDKNYYITTLLNQGFDFSVELDTSECWTAIYEAIWYDVNYETLTKIIDECSYYNLTRMTASGEKIFDVIKRANYYEADKLIKYLKEIRIYDEEEEEEEYEEDTTYDEEVINEEEEINYERKDINKAI